MRIVDTDLPEVKLIEPKVFGDDRGFFMESWRADWLSELGDWTFVQDNHSSSAKGVLRGLHSQNPKPQGKLVRVLSGSVFDVAVDIRPGSPNFGRWVGVELSAENKRMIWVPPGFAHGFLSLEDKTQLFYKCTDYYAPQYEQALAWNDPDLNIAWPDLGMAPVLSAKDAAASPLAALEARA